MNESPQDDLISWSVVIPTFNRPAMLKRAIESCIAQTLSCEIIVVDDGLQDETVETVSHFPQVIYFRNPKNLGHSASVNRGMDRASGSWIKHVDDDDFLRSDCLQKMSDAISKARAQGHTPKIITCVSNNIDIGEAQLGRTRTLPVNTAVVIKSEHLLQMMMCDQAPLGTPVQVGHDRQAALDCGGWNEQRIFKFQSGDEVEFWIRLAPSGDAIFLPDALAFRTIWSGNEKPSHADRLAISLYLKERIAERLTGFTRTRGKTPSDIARYLALHWGLVALKDKDFAVGLRLMLGGMFSPSSYRYIWRRSRYADAMKFINLLD